MPTSDEYKKLAMDRSISGKLASDTGYWIEDGKDFVWRTGTPPSSDVTNGMIQELTNRDLARPRPRDLGRDLDLARALARARDLALDLDLDRALDLARALALALARDLALYRNPSNRPIDPTEKEPSHQDEKAEFLRWLVRYLMLVLARYLRYCSITTFPTRKRTWVEQFLRKKSDMSQDAIVFEDAIRSYLDLYVSLALLELRIQGKIPAWEGILLVKERKLKG